MTGEFPDKWKNSVIIPTKKVSNAQHPQEFRPINTKPYTEKLFEKLIKKQLIEYVTNNNILIENQSGFRAKHSCETSLQLIISRWKCWIDKPGRVVVAAFLDLRRAFETISRKLLLQKLQAMGVRGNEIKWFQSFLSGRTQTTKIGSTLSIPIASEMGVPQGTVIGPLLFILYTRGTA